MGKWFEKLGKQFGGLLGGSGQKPLTPEERLEQTIRDALATIEGARPSDKKVRDVIEQDQILGTWYEDAKEANAEHIAASVEWDGLRYIDALREQHSGYLLVFAQPYVGLLLEKLSQAPKPIVGVVFQSHEDPTAHISVLERGHGLGFGLQFYPDEGPVFLVNFFGRLACLSRKAIDFAVQAKAPIIPVWARMTSPGSFTLHLSRPFEVTSTPEPLATHLMETFMGRIQADPDQMDWTAACWQPPVKRLFTSRRQATVAMGSDQSLKDLVPLKLSVRAPDDIREACLAIPAIRALKQGRPDVRLTILSTPLLAPLWRALAACDEFIPLESGKTNAPGARADFGIILNREAGSAAAFSRNLVDRLVGMENHPDADLFDDVLAVPRKLGPPEHRHRRYLRIAHRMGAEVESASLWAPLERLEWPPETASFCLGIAPGSNDGPAYQWPKERFAEIIDLFQHGKDVVWRILLPNASEGDLRFWQGIRDSHPEHKIDIIAMADSLDSAFAQLPACDILIANDNHLLHLGAVAGLGVIAIYGPSDPILSAPVGEHAMTVHTHVECSPCSLSECPLDHRCLTQIEPTAVVTALDTLIRQSTA